MTDLLRIILETAQFRTSELLNVAHHIGRSHKDSIMGSNPTLLREHVVRLSSTGFFFSLSVGRGLFMGRIPSPAHEVILNAY